MTQPTSSDVLEPINYYEKIDSDGCPHPIDGDIGIGFAKSNIKEIAFSKTIAGAILGSVQNQCKDPTSLCTVTIYSTRKVPHVDISHCGFDFSVLDEVRFRNPVHVQKKAQFNLSPKIVRQIQACYGLSDDYGNAYIDYDSLYQIKDHINKQLLQNKSEIK